MASLERRQFLMGAGVATQAWAAARPAAKSAGRVLGANDRINVGVIGTGGRGTYVAREFMNVGKLDGNAQIVAVCDVYQKRVNRNKEFYTKEYGKCCLLYTSPSPRDS